MAVNQLSSNTPAANTRLVKVDPVVARPRPSLDTQDRWAGKAKLEPKLAEDKRNWGRFALGTATAIAGVAMVAVATFAATTVGFQLAVGGFLLAAVGSGMALLSGR